MIRTAKHDASGGDLRRQALESGKTMSRKQRTKDQQPSSSRQSSATKSTPTSRNVSRHGSEDEDGGMSDTTSQSYASFEDEYLESDEEEVTGIENWEAYLQDRVEEMIDRKRSSNTGREKTLRGYITVLTRHYCPERIKNKLHELVASMLWSIKSEESELEACLACKALELTIITLPSDDLWDEVNALLTSKYKYSHSLALKTAAIHTLGTASALAGTMSDEALALMDELCEIIETDGASVEAEDSTEVVTAAIQEWSNLVIDMEDFGELSNDAVEIFAAQLESTSSPVLNATIHAIALLYEKSCDQEADRGPEDPPPLAYIAYRDKDTLIDTVANLSKVPLRYIPKKDRAATKAGLQDLIFTIEDPFRGPGYRNVVGPSASKMASYHRLRLPGDMYIPVEEWWVYERILSFKRILGGGISVHAIHNPVLYTMFPPPLPMPEKQNKSIRP